MPNCASPFSHRTALAGRSSPHSLTRMSNMTDTSTVLYSSRTKRMEGLIVFRCCPSLFLSEPGRSKWWPSKCSKREQEGVEMHAPQVHESSFVHPNTVLKGKQCQRLTGVELRYSSYTVNGTSQSTTNFLSLTTVS